MTAIFNFQSLKFCSLILKFFAFAFPIYSKSVMNSIQNILLLHLFQSEIIIIFIPVSN